MICIFFFTDRYNYCRHWLAELLGFYSPLHFVCMTVNEDDLHWVLFRFMMDKINSVSKFFCWCQIQGVRSKSRDSSLSLSSSSYTVFNNTTATSAHTHALHTHRTQSDVVMWVRTVCFPLWLLFSLLAKTKPASYWTRQRLIVSERLPLVISTKLHVLHTSLKLSSALGQTQAFLFSGNLISFFHCQNPAWKVVPLFRVQIFCHAFPRFTSSPHWIWRLWGFPNQTVLDRYCENLTWKLKRVLFIYILFSFLSPVRILWEMSCAQLPSLFIAKGLISFLGTKRKIDSGGGGALSLWTLIKQIYIHRQFKSFIALQRFPMCLFCINQASTVDCCPKNISTVYISYCYSIWLLNCMKKSCYLDKSFLITN